MKPGIGPGDLDREAESLIRQLQAGNTVTLEMQVRISDSVRHAASVRILERLVWLVEGVGEVQMFDSRERLRPKVVLVPIPPPSAAESCVPAPPHMPH